MEQPAAEIALLGPLEVRVSGAAVAIGRPMQRALLARLALESGSCVSTTRLIDALWGEATPGSAGHALQVHVSSLRKLLGPGLLETCPGGYRLALPRDAVDALHAEDLIAAGAFEEALALYRGAPLADVALEGQAAHEDARLADLRLDALERRTDERLAAGEGASLVAGLERLVAESPLRERPRAQLMLALYRAGRQADALAAYQDARRTFVDELGLEPSRELRELEAAILRHDESLRPPAAAAPAVRQRRVRVAIASAGFALVAGAAGVGAAYLIPPGHPHAAVASRRTTTERPPPPTTTTRRVTTVRARKPRKVVHRHVHPHPTTTVRDVDRTPAHTTTAPVTTAPTTTKDAPPPPPTTTARVTTHPIRTTPPPTTTAPPTTAPTGAVHLVDTFDSSVVNSSVWNVFFNGDGADIVQRNGKLVVSIAGGATPGGSYDFVGAQYGSRGCFSGDIDMQVDYKLDTWPAGSGAYVGLQAVYANAMVERFAPVGGSDVVGSMIDPRFKQVSTNATSGSLRLTRVNGIVTTYYLLAGAWQPIDTASAPSPAHLHIGVSLVPATSPTSNIVVELDNFSATAYGPTTC